VPDSEVAEVAAAVDRACRDIGFLVISGHGIAPELVDETRAVAPACGRVA
jgi:isopenicillin N synthase-like dioxygenase